MCSFIYTVIVPSRGLYIWCLLPFIDDDGAHVNVMPWTSWQILLILSKKMMVKVEGNIKSDTVNMQGVVFVFYLILCAFLLGNFITFWHKHLLPLIKNYPSGLEVKYYRNSELQLIRGEMNQNPHLNRLPSWSDLESQISKIHKKGKEEDMEE